MRVRTQCSTRPVTLDWVRVKRENLLPRVKKAIGAGAAGFGVRRSARGWIALQDLQSDRARAVVKAVEDQKRALREALVSWCSTCAATAAAPRSWVDRSRPPFSVRPQQRDVWTETEAACGGPDGAGGPRKTTSNNWNFCKPAALVVAGGPESRDGEDTFATPAPPSLGGRGFPAPSTARSRHQAAFGTRSRHRS